MKLPLFFWAMALLPFFQNPAWAQEKVTPSPKSISTDTSQALATAQSDFGIRFFQEILKENPGQNILVSPYSLSTALGMALNGAAGETRKVMAQAMGLGLMGLPEVNRENLALQNELQNTDPDTRFDVANSLWANKNYTIEPDFLRVNQLYYGAEVDSLDFSLAGAVGKINQWVSDKTQGKIPTILQTLEESDMMVLVNAVYFKGLWTSPFKKEATRPAPFHLSDGTSVDRPRMNQQGRFSYFETAAFQAISLPYGKMGGSGNGGFSLMVFLPKSETNLADWAAQLTPENWNGWMGQFKPTEVRLSLPKFKVEFESGLVPCLTQMGMGLAFGGGADFSHLSPTPCRISEVVQKTYMVVDEEGTEAAAATAIVVRALAIRMPPPALEMVVDHPFFVALMDNQTKTILFEGVVLDPKL